MTSTTQLQAVAQRLERMLETALEQLKLEQKARREGEAKLVDLELSLVNAEHALKSEEERCAERLGEKEGWIAGLETKVDMLGGLLQEKEQELLDSREQEQGQEPVVALQERAGRFEDRLKVFLTETGKTGVTDDDYDDVVMDEEETETKNEETVVHKYPKDETLEEFDPNLISRCNVCTDEFPSKKELYEHEKETSHGYILYCTICERKFKTKYTLKSHVDRVHSDVMPFKCSKCEQRFKDEGSMRRHQANDQLHKRLEREKLSPFLMCNICGKEFPRKRRWCLDQHYLTHIETKRFPCPHCGKEFLREGYFKKHLIKCEGVKGEED